VFLQKTAAEAAAEATCLPCLAAVVSTRLEAFGRRVDCSGAFREGTFNLGEFSRT